MESADKGDPLELAKYSPDDVEDEVLIDVSLSRAIEQTFLTVTLDMLG